MGQQGADEALTRALASNNPIVLIEAHANLAICAALSGDTAKAEKHFGAACDFEDHEISARSGLQVGQLLIHVDQGAARRVLEGALRSAEEGGLVKLRADILAELRALPGTGGG